MEERLSKFLVKNKFLIGLAVSGLLLVTFFVLSVCYCYAHCVKIKQMQKNDPEKAIGVMDKTIGSMKKVNNPINTSPNSS